VTIYFHNGSGKAGSTSIQLFLARNRDRLRERGYLYPQSAGPVAHIWLLLHALEPRRLARNPYTRVHGAEQVLSERRNFVPALKAEIEKERPQHIVFSQETCFRNLLPSEIERLRQLFLEIGGETKLITYLRRQSDHVCSAYQQTVRGGETRPLSEVLENRATSARYRYCDLLSGWAEAFGKDNLRVRPFERSAFPGGDLISDFLSAIGVPDDESFDRPLGQQNEGLDAKRTEFLRRLNPLVPVSIDGRKNPMRGDLVQLLKQRTEGATLRLSPAEAEHFDGVWAEQNERVAREFLGRSDGVLFRDRPRSLEDGGRAELGAEETLRIFSELWNARTQRIRELEEKNRLLREGSLRRRLRGMGRRVLGALGDRS
jgi:hypothetical protein